MYVNLPNLLKKNSFYSHTTCRKRFSSFELDNNWNTNNASLKNSRYLYVNRKISSEMLLTQ